MTTPSNPLSDLEHTIEADVERTADRLFPTEVAAAETVVRDADTIPAVQTAVTEVKATLEDRVKVLEDHVFAFLHLPVPDTSSPVAGS
jgi:hypothetical protein